MDIPTAPSVYRRRKYATFEVLSKVLLNNQLFWDVLSGPASHLVTDVLVEPTASNLRTKELRRQSQETAVCNGVQLPWRF